MYCAGRPLVDAASLNSLIFMDHDVLGSELAKTNGIQLNRTHMTSQAVNIHGKKTQLHQPIVLRPVGSLLRAAMGWLAGVVIMSIFLLKPLPALALAVHDALGSSSIAAMSLVAAMPNKAKAVAKDTEGKLESAYGDLTGDTERQIKGKAKQGQASAMKAGEDLKEGAKSVAKKVGDATR